ncbi:MAG: metallophosphoesterase [Kiritimatiellae bacterium]|nr:metallophosphoesterase [Kiritimatiellia bacterium]
MRGAGTSVSAAPCGFAAGPTLEARMGARNFARRLDLELNRERKFGGLVRWCPMRYAGPAVDFAFRALGLWEKAHREFLDIATREESFAVSGLPEALDGFTILHMSDLHLDISPDLAPALREALARVAGRYDIACITGDFSNFTVHSDKAAIKAAASLREAFTAPVFGCLGNHDSICDVPDLEKAGFKILLNESVRVRRKGGGEADPGLMLAGIDDPNIFGTGDMERALSDRRAGEPVVLLAHAPSIYAEAAARGVSLALCGHVHGGQICLRSGRAIAPRRWKFPARVRRGRWVQGSAQGYTTTGVGACGAPLRLNCPPELVLVRLRRAGAVDAPQ